MTMLRSPDALTVVQGYTKPVVAALRTYSFFENVLGPGRGAEAFPMASAESPWKFALAASTYARWRSPPARQASFAHSGPGADWLLSSSLLLEPTRQT